jgi:predicted protein tyrosine phosphatase
MLVRLPELMSSARERRIRVLFICHYNRRRSATAERVFAKDPSLDVRSAGTSSEAMVPVNERMIEWADIVFVMEGEQRADLERAFPAHPGLAKIVTLDVSDDYHFLDPELVSLLKERVGPHLETFRQAPGRRP